MKTCRLCNLEKSTDEFWKKNTRSKDGLQFDCKSCMTEANKIRQREIRVKALDNLGGKCVECGFSDYRALQVDHIEGGGHHENKNGRNQAVYSKIAKGETDGYQLLCANCNWIKRAENNEIGRYYLDRK